MIQDRAKDVGGRSAHPPRSKERRAVAGQTGSGSRTKAEPCQTRVLEDWQRGAALLEVTLVNGVKIRGTLTSFDSYIIALQSRGEVQLVYKQAILVIVPVSAQS
ncbi:MAG TPA: RNA chaperone Hfq, partial [Burkholderiales bacterium]|nr:RNA chaperone Hfq [Burkholderiales bacterium]